MARYYRKRTNLEKYPPEHGRWLAERRFPQWQRALMRAEQAKVRVDLLVARKRDQAGAESFDLLLVLSPSRDSPGNLQQKQLASSPPRATRPAASGRLARSCCQGCNTSPRCDRLLARPYPCHSHQSGYEATVSDPSLPRLPEAGRYRQVRSSADEHRYRDQQGSRGLQRMRQTAFFCKSISNPIRKICGKA